MRIDFLKIVLVSLVSVILISCSGGTGINTIEQEENPQAPPQTPISMEPTEPEEPDVPITPITPITPVIEDTPVIEEGEEGGELFLPELEDQAFVNLSHMEFNIPNATGGVPPYAYSYTHKGLRDSSYSNNLPKWLTGSGTTISGYATTATGFYPIKVTVTDHAEMENEVEGTFTLLIASALVPYVPFIAEKTSYIGDRIDLTFPVTPVTSRVVTYEILNLPSGLTSVGSVVTGVITGPVKSYGVTYRAESEGHENYHQFCWHIKEDASPIFTSKCAIIDTLLPQ